MITILNYVQFGEEKNCTFNFENYFTVTKRNQKSKKEQQSAVLNQIRNFSFTLLNYFGEWQPNRNFFFHIFAEKIFVCQALKANALKANALSTLNWFIDRMFIPI